MRGLTLLILITLQALAVASDLSADCQQRQGELRRKIKILSREAVSVLGLPLGVLQDHAIATDAENIQTKCDALKASVEEWEHADHAGEMDLWRKVIAAQNEFARQMNSMMSRDRAGWDGALKDIVKQGYKVDVNYKTFVITITKDLGAGSEAKLKTTMDFCSPEAVDGNPGAVTTKVVMGEKVNAASFSTEEFAKLNLPKECGIEADASAIRIQGEGAERN